MQGFVIFFASSPYHRLGQGLDLVVTNKKHHKKKDEQITENEKKMRYSQAKKSVITVPRGLFYSLFGRCKPHKHPAT